jgi:hypothetical protein
MFRSPIVPDVVVMERSVVGRLAGVLGVSSVETVF